MKNSRLTTLICGLIAVAVTIICYVLIFDSIFSVPMRWISLIALLIAEALWIVKSLFITRDIITNACLIISCIHLALVILIAVLFLIFFESLIKVYILLNVLIICLLAVADLFILHFGKNVSASNKLLRQGQGVMDACYVKAQGMAVEFSASEYANALTELADMIKYSDNSELVGDEVEIMNKLTGIELEIRQNGDNISRLIAEAKSAIELRSIKMKSIKRGGY